MRDFEGFQSSDAWNMFKDTGSVGMYLLYKALREDEVKEDKKL